MNHIDSVGKVFRAEIKVFSKILFPEIFFKYVKCIFCLQFLSILTIKIFMRHLGTFVITIIFDNDYLNDVYLFISTKILPYMCVDVCI